MAATRKETGPLVQRRLSTEAEAALRAGHEIRLQKEVGKMLRATAGKIPRSRRCFDKWLLGYG
jgi:hypothetical protein